MPRVSKRLIYQRACWQQPTTTTLHSALVAALKAVREPARAQPLSDDADGNNGTWRKLIRGIGRNNCAFGKLVQYTHGTKQETVKIRRGENDAPDGAVAAPEGEEFSEGPLYFCVDGDHVVVAQSLGLRIAQLEAYLNWLLREKSGIVTPDNFLSLESLPPDEARRILARSVPKSVTFARPVQLERSQTTTASKVYSTQATLEAVESFMGVDDLHELLPAKALESGRIKTSVTFSWNSRVGGGKPEEFLRGMGRFALRHMDEDPEAEVEIETEAGKLSRRHLSMAESFTLEAPDGVIAQGAINEVMIKYLAKLRQGSQIRG